MLITVLMLSILLVTMGLGFLGSRVGQYQSTIQSVLAVRARELARAGIEDARTKLNRDNRFPPPVGTGQSVFTYSENFNDASGNFVGIYQVSLDSTYAATPFFVQSITSTGIIGPRTAPVASHTYRAYLDISPTSPRYFQIIRWEDLGCP